MKKHCTSRVESHDERAPMAVANVTRLPARLRRRQRTPSWVRGYDLGGGGSGAATCERVDSARSVDSAACETANCCVSGCNSRLGAHDLRPLQHVGNTEVGQC